MNLGKGSRIGPFEVLSALGAGGMGEVYRARDERLGRDVAIKLLPASLANDGQSLARLEREARTLAGLNHPNIAAIYGLEEGEGLRALVMELVEGETLAEHIRGKGGIGPKPMAAEEALPIGKQIADALEYAHERNVIHRDLKPANVKITPEGAVKVLDFGLAKVISDPESIAPVSASNSPTLSAMATQAGIILGTAAYMAPEQAKGKPVDRRADIWAFGCVLYEMLAGEKPFSGETVSDVLAAVIRGEPEWTALPATTPPAVERLIRRCLQKDPRQRLQAIGDARITIEEILSGDSAGATVAGAPIVGTAQPSRVRRVLPWALGATTLICAGIAAWLVFRPAPQLNVVRFELAPPANAQLVLGGEMSLSPDGRVLAFVTQPASDKPTTLWLRPLDSVSAHPIPGTDGAVGPFWSVDSQQLGFEAAGKLMKLAISGGTVQTICDVDGFTGATWNREGVIVFSNAGSLYRVAETGGEPSLAVAPDASRHETSLGFPEFLPDGKHFIFQALTGTSNDNILEAGALDSKTVKSIGQMDAQAYYAAPGYLFYTDQRTLFARPFSARALRFTGPALPITQNVARMPYYNFSYFSVSSAGVLAYQDVAVGGLNQITWFNRSGEKLGTIGQVEIHTAPALSPDGSQFAVATGDFGKRDIWIYDLRRGTASRLTSGPADATNTTWSPDGTQIVFSSNPHGPYDLYQKSANGLGSAQIFFQNQQQKHLDDLSSDGRYGIYDTAAGNTELWALPLFGDRKPFPFVQGDFHATSAVFSPNSRYVAYMSSETGGYQIYVQNFPQQNGKWQISAAGGLQPEWSHDGKELFYLASDGKLMAVDVNTNAPNFQAGIPKPLFQTQLETGYLGRNMFVVSPDAQRFLILAPASAFSESEPINVVVNWPSLLKR